jgi:subtilase family serine protease
VAVAGLAGCVVAAAGVVLGAPGIARAASAVPVPGSAAPAGVLVGAVPASQQLTVQMWLTPDLAGATTFANSVATPGSSAFHHYLSPDAYTAQFGPSAAQAAAVTAWLTAEGLTQVHADSGRDYVSATGPVSRIQSAFGVRMEKYRVMGADGKPAVIESNDRDVSVPASLAPDVLGVTGLDSAPPVTSAAGSAPGPLEPAAAPACSHYWAQYTKSFRPAYRGLTKGSLPVCGYSAGQIRAAYGATTTATGKGETVALTEEEAPPAMLATLKDYAKGNHLPAPRAAQFREQIATGGTCGASSGGAAQSGFYPGEAQMDSEAVYAMAPGAAQLMVVGESCNEAQSLLDAALSVVTGNGARPSASIVSNSWGLLPGDVPAQAVHAMDLRAAAEGVGMYFASGDAPGAFWVTDSDPYVTAVGGTTLGIGAKNNRVFETGWSDDYASLDAGTWDDQGSGGGDGGGTSLVWGQPAYQKGVVPASMSRVRVGKRIVTDRTMPDIAADGDPDSGIVMGYIATGTDAHPGPYQTQVGAGTSLASPLIAGLVADAQQGQKSAFGFINPLIYRLAGTQAFHDILPVTASMPQQDQDAWEPPSAGVSPAVDVFDSQERAWTQQVTAKGYDTMTGVGTPNGAAFITGLRRAADCSH